MFWIIVGISSIGGFVFVLFGSGEHQSWDKELAESSSARNNGGDDADDDDVGDIDSSSSPLLKGRETDWTVNTTRTIQTNSNIFKLLSDKILADLSLR